MSQPNRPTFLAAMEPNPLHKAADDYQLMETQRDAAVAKAGELAATNAGLLAEVGLLREQMNNSERERKRVQAVASTFAGHARSLAAILNDIMAVAIKNGVEAAEKPDTGLEQAGATAQTILQRVEPAVAPIPLVSPRTPPQAPVGLGTPIPPSAGLMRPVVSNGTREGAA